MAVNNNFQYNPPTAGTNWYVSAFWGDDLNAGTAIAPFKTKAKAELSGASDDNIIMGAGFYQEESSVSTNAYNFYGEGLVIINQPGGAVAPALNSATERVENIIFTNWTTTSVLSLGDSGGPGKDVKTFVNCQFVDCIIRAGLDSSFGYFVGCIFDTIEFPDTGITDSSPIAGGILNCIFRECTGFLPPLDIYIDGILHNHFVESDTLMLGIAGGQPVNSFDYNNIEGGLNGFANNAAIQGQGFNINGSAFLSINIFNDFDILRSTSDYFKQDYTQKDTSPLLFTSRSKGPLARFNEGARFDAAFLEGSNSDISDINLVGDELQLVALASEGFIINELDLGAVKNINLINILQDIQWNAVSGQGEVIADFLEDMGTDIKATYDIEIKHKKLVGDSFTTTTVEYDKYVLDRSPQVIEAQFLEINLTLRDYTI